MSWSGRRVLVTGAGGFIGSQLVERLIELGASVRGFDVYNSSARGGGSMNRLSGATSRWCLETFATPTASAAPQKVSRPSSTSRL